VHYILNNEHLEQPSSICSSNCFCTGDASLGVRTLEREKTLDRLKRKRKPESLAKHFVKTNPPHQHGQTLSLEYIYDSIASLL